VTVAPERFQVRIVGPFSTLKPILANRDHSLCHYLFTMMSMNTQKGTAKVGSMIRPPGGILQGPTNKENDKTTINKTGVAAPVDAKVRIEFDFMLTPKKCAYRN
jgi:hypothetical protein